MTQQILPLVNWGNGIIMIGIFLVFVIVLILVLMSLMNGDKKDKI